MQISKPKQCESLRRDKQRNCQVNIYSPNFLGRKMSAATCEITQIMYETYVNFLGYRRITKRLPLHAHMGIERCRQVIQTKQDDVAGRLKNMGNGVYATQNSELNLKYAWLATQADTITNVVIRSKRNIYYNRAQNHLFSTFTDLTRCTPTAGACITPDVTAIWNKRDIDVCKIAKERKLKMTDIVQFRDTNSNKYHVYAPTLTMSFKNFVKDEEIS